MTRLLRILIPAGAALAAVLPSTALAADPVFETLRVPTVGGEEIHVEIARPAGDAKAPVILTYSPYNTIGETRRPNLANDTLGKRFLPKGYARAVADVLGTRNSTGCWDYGGPLEQQSGVDLVNALAEQPWANGKVAMIGGSYDGTTANMVAAAGAEAKGLAAIVPQAAISRWYGYAYQDGVRYFMNSEVPTDEGFDTPLAFDLGLARTPPTQAAGAPALEDRVKPCDVDDHTGHGYDRTPDYDGFWLERDYRKDAARFRVPALVTHGWQDYNVKQSEGTDLFRALQERSKAPFNKLFVFQGAHGTPDHDQYATLVERFFARTLKGERNGIATEPPVWTEGRSGTKTVALRTEDAWPPRGTRTRSFAIEPGSYTDSGAQTEETALRAPKAEQGWLYSESAPLKYDLRMTGAAVVDLTMTLNRTSGHLAPTLVDVAPGGSTTAISRGFLNLQYREGLERARAVEPGKAFRARVRLAPQDQTIPAGHRIGLVLASSNVVWALPDSPGAGVTVLDGSALKVPAAPTLSK